MESVIQSYLDVLNMLHEECKEQIYGLGVEQLDWKPGEDINSLAVLAAHIAGAEKHWITEAILGETSGRDRPAEFATQGVGVDTLVGALDDALEFVRKGLSTLSVDDLARKVTSPRDGSEISIALALGHVLQHTALHLGNMQINRQLVMR